MYLSESERTMKRFCRLTHYCLVVFLCALSLFSSLSQAGSNSTELELNEPTILAQSPAVHNALKPSSLKKDLLNKGFSKPAETNLKPAVSRPLLTVATNQDTYPYQFENSLGLADGLLIDLWRLWSEKTGIDLKFEIYAWHESLTALENQDVDIHAGMAALSNRKSDFAFAKPWTQLYSHVFIHRDIAGLDHLAQIKPYVVGALQQSGHIAELNKRVEDLKLQEFESQDALYQAVLEGKIKAFAGLSRISNQVSDYKRLRQTFPLFKRLPIRRYDLSPAVAKDNASLLEVIQAGFSQITPLEIRAIETKWLGTEIGRDKLILALPYEFPPYMHLSSQGEPIGLFVDLWRLWSEQTNREIEFLPLKPQDALQAVANGEADALVAYPYFNPEVAKRFDLTEAEHLYSSDISLYYWRDLGDFKDASQISGVEIGVFSDPGLVSSLSRNFPNIRWRTFDNWEQLIGAAQQREIAGFVAISHLANNYLVRHKLFEYFTTSDKFNYQTDLNVLVNRKKRALIDQVKEGFRLISLERKTQVEDKWVASARFRYYNMLGKQFELTQAEKTWISEHRIIKAGVLDNWAPIEFVDDEGNVAGVTKDILSYVEQQTGLSIQYQVYPDWKSLLESLERGELDVVGSIVDTPERRAYLNFTESYWQTPWAFLHHGSQNNLVYLRQLKGKRLALVEDYQLLSELIERFPDVKLVPVKNTEIGVQLLKEHKVDAVIDNLVTVSQLVKVQQLMNMQVSVVQDLKVEDESFGVRKDWPLLKDIMNKSLNAITENQKRFIVEKWFLPELERGLDKRLVLNIALQVAFVVMFILISILYWNRKLRREIASREILQQEMAWLAHHDQLTRLGNRNSLEEKLQLLIAKYRKTQQKFAMAFVDLDGFKPINDQHGHAVGDQVLITIAHLLEQYSQKSASAFRYGGDEFILLIEQFSDKSQLKAELEQVLQLCQQPIEVNDISVQVSASIGVAIYPEHADGSENLLNMSDEMMYKAKLSGKNQIQILGHFIHE